MKIDTIIAVAVAILAIAGLTVIVGSWIANALFPESEIQSLLSAVGIRWLIGKYSTLMSTEILIDIILAGMAYGMLKRGVLAPIKDEEQNDISHFALHLTIAVAAICASAILLLTFLPHAILLSATGKLAGSAAAHGLIPMLSLSVCLTTMTYGFCTSRFTSIKSLYEALIAGVRAVAPLIVLYIFIAQLFITSPPAP